VFLRHAKLYEMMTKNKEGEIKEVRWLEFARRCARVREATISNLEFQRRGTATEHAMPGILDETQTATCYRRLGEDMLWNDLLPHQKWKPVYQVRYDWRNNINLSTRQRSWIDSMLRRTLGDKKVAFFIWTHGLPGIFDASSDRNCKVGKAELERALDKGMTWYASLLQSAVEYERETEAEKRHQCEGQEQRKAAIQQLRKMLTKGKSLAEERDSSKRKFEDMCTKDQTLLEDYETGKLKKQRNAYELPPHKPFRGELQPWDGPATKQAARPETSKEATNKKRKRRASP
jgi:hypothetical protein